MAVDDIGSCFGQTYAEARTQFLFAADGAGLPVQAHRHPLVGADGEDLGIDVARFGAADAQRLLIVTSGCHGVEGFCGSGIQVALLRDPSLHQEWRCQLWFPQLELPKLHFGLQLERYQPLGEILCLLMHFDLHSYW